MITPDGRELFDESGCFTPTKPMPAERIEALRPPLRRWALVDTLDGKEFHVVSKHFTRAGAELWQRILGGLARPRAQDFSLQVRARSRI